MALDTLEQQGINIKNLAIEEKQGKAPFVFDPSREIPEEEWGNIIGSLTRKSPGQNRITEHEEMSKAALGGSSSTDNYLRKLAYIKVLHPSLPPEFEMTDEEFQSSCDLIKEEENSNWWRPGRMYSALKLIAPEKFNKAHPVPLDEYLPAAKRLINGYRSVNNWGMLAITALDAKIIAPERFDEIGITQGDFDTMRQNALLMASRGEYTPESELAILVGHLKIFSPEHARGIKFTPIPWEGIKKSWNINGMLTSSLGFNEQEVFDMTAASAKEIKVTDNGIEIILPETGPDLGKAVPSLPEGRKF